MSRPPRRRASWAAVLALLLAFVGLGTWVLLADHRAEGGFGRRARGVGEIEPGEPQLADADTWRRHAWAADGGSTGPALELSPDERREHDPQWTAMRRSFGLEGDAGQAPLPFAPVARAGRIVEQQGTMLTADQAADCRVRVLPVHSSRYGCLVRVSCAGLTLYPNPSQTGGYVPCELREGAPAQARDDVHSAVDGDPILHLDWAGGRVVVEDRGDGVTPMRAVIRLDPRP